MDQHSNNNLSEFLQTLLANPADGADSYTYNLQQLVDDFPQSGVFHALLSRYSDEKNLQRAALYFNPGSLYKLIHTPSDFRNIAFEKINVQTGILADEHSGNNENLFTEVNDDQAEEVIAVHENYFSEYSTPGAETAAPSTEEILVEDEVQDSLVEVDTGEPAEQETEPVADELVEDTLAETLITEIPESETEVEDENVFDEDPAVAKLTEADADETENATLADNLVEDTLAETLITEIPESETEVEDEVADQLKEPDLTKTNEIEPVSDEAIENIAEEHHEVASNGEVNGEPIEDETFEEIGSVDVSGTKSVEIEVSQENPAENHNTEADDSARETEKLILNNIAGADFFMFDKAFGARAVKETEEQTQGAEEFIVEAPKILPAFTTDSDTEQVSKYHDDKMPYTFMWWLDKTRNEHRGIYQPYAQPPAATNDTNNKLEQQYYENIFHLSSTEDLEKSTATQTIQFDMKRPELVKEHKIIERFLKEEPQIKPQSSDKLDNENKAKRSAEDKDEEMITETLAVIYTDQMLYHKAIATYKKLMLKFPEKSVYFAGKIELLEKKTN